MPKIGYTRQADKESMNIRIEAGYFAGTMDYVGIFLKDFYLVFSALKS